MRLAAVLWVVVACTMGPPQATEAPQQSEDLQAIETPPFALRLTIQMEASTRVTIVDRSGLVVGAVRRDVPSLDLEASVAAVPDERLIDIAWQGGACDASILEIRGSLDRLSLILEKNEGAATLPGTECPAIGLNHGLVLTLLQPVQHDAVSFRVLPPRADEQQ